ncbi:MAG: response regulator [Gemmatimonadota bacterium]|nr:response regulator [Gemmatimonadota bacterium]
MPSKTRVLVVDDEKELLGTVKRILKIEGIDAQTAEGPFEALEILAESGFDVVITDIRMPKMDGVRLISRIKELYPMTQVMILTGYSNMGYLVDCFGAGAVDFFGKPLRNHEKFVTAVIQALEKASRWREGISVSYAGVGG